MFLLFDSGRTLVVRSTTNGGGKTHTIMKAVRSVTHWLGGEKERFTYHGSDERLVEFAFVGTREHQSTIDRLISVEMCK